MTVSRIVALALGSLALALPVLSVDPPSEAPSGFDNLTNGLTDQATFEADMKVFNQQESIEDGLGPTYNAQSCGECHQNPVAGGISQLTEQRAGHFDGRSFVDHPGGSLVHARATNAEVQERVQPDNEVRTFRTSLNTLGDGFVEAIADQTLEAIADDQSRRSRGRIRGRIVRVPIVEAAGELRVGRFGWKGQHASLLSFSGDAYLNEMGITNLVMGEDAFARENTSNGRPVDAFDPVPDPEDDGEDVETFARFMRATKAPPRDGALAATRDAQSGAQLFEQIGCAVCHTPAIVTALPGTLINGGTFTVPDALGNKTIRPFGDFLLHDVGTGDGVVQNGGNGSRNTVRTAPLWGVRTRNHLMHDGESLTFNDAILRHAGEAASVINSYRNLRRSDREKIARFLESL